MEQILSEQKRERDALTFAFKFEFEFPFAHFELWLWPQTDTCLMAFAQSAALPPRNIRETYAKQTDRQTDKRTGTERKLSPKALKNCSFEGPGKTERKTLAKFYSKLENDCSQLQSKL